MLRHSYNLISTYFLIFNILYISSPSPGRPNHALEPPSRHPGHMVRPGGQQRYLLPECADAFAYLHYGGCCFCEMLVV